MVEIEWGDKQGTFQKKGRVSLYFRYSAIKKSNDGIVYSEGNEIEWAIKRITSTKIRNRKEHWIIGEQYI